jgi:3'-5' exonuclease
MTNIHLIIDIESSADLVEHARYQKSERFCPQPGSIDSGRRGQRGQEDPLTTPRWPFQSVLAVSVMKCVSGGNGALWASEMFTLSLADMDEAQILTRLFQYIGSMPANDIELVTFGGSNHDLPVLACRAMAHGLQLPKALSWLAFGGTAKAPHLDLLRVLTGGFKMRQCHMAEFAAVMDLPSKFVASSWTITRLANRGDWKKIEEVVESDVITTSMLFASWRALLTGGAVWSVHDQICRKVQELRPERSYLETLQAMRRRLYDQQMRDAKAKLDVIGLPQATQVRASTSSKQRSLGSIH